MMTVLAPPTIIGPVVVTSPVIRVDGVLAGASVDVSADDGTVHASGIATSNGSVTLGVTVALNEGMLFAQQTLGADVSGRSWNGCPVVQPPRDLPRPTFDAVMNRCSDACLVSGLVPGAEVTIRRAGTKLVAETAQRIRQWISLSTQLQIGDVLTAEQTLPGSNPSPLARLNR